MDRIEPAVEPDTNSEPAVPQEPAAEFCPDASPAPETGETPEAAAEAEAPEAAEPAEKPEEPEPPEPSEKESPPEAEAAQEETEPPEAEAPPGEEPPEAAEGENPTEAEEPPEDNALPGPEEPAAVTPDAGEDGDEEEKKPEEREFLYNVLVQEEVKKPVSKKRKALRIALTALTLLLSLALAGLALFHHLYSQLDTETEGDQRMEASVDAWRDEGGTLDDDERNMKDRDPEEPTEAPGPVIPPEEYLVVSMEEGPDSETLAARAQEVAQEAEQRMREAQALQEQADALLQRSQERRLYEEELDRQEQQRLQDEIRAAIEADGGTPITDANVMNVLLLGTDTRDMNREWSRADSMILLSVNKNTKQIILTSFMRDTYVYMRRADTYNRLNVANVIGGPNYSCQVLGEVFGVKVDQYAMVNFFSFIDVVDAMGGVDIEVREDEISDLNDNLVHQNYVRGYEDRMDFVEHGPTRMMHLNGNQTLAYARIRYVGGDRERTERQRRVITLLMDKLKGLKLTELYDLLETVLPLVKTNLSELDCLTVMLSAPEYLEYEVKSIRIPVDGSWKFSRIDEKSVVEITDLGWCRSYLRREIYG